MNNSFVASARHTFLLAVFLFTGFAQVWGQTTNLKNSNIVTTEPAVLWKNEPFGKYDLSKEIIEKRDVSSKHFRNEDGSITAHLAAGEIHYEENGQLKTIYHTIVPNGNGFENLTNSHKTWYPATSSGSIKTTLKNGAVIKDMLGMRMYYEVNGQAVQLQNIQSKAGEANFNQLTYNGVYGNGIDLRLTQNTTQRKLDYIIQNKAALGNIPSGAKYLIFEENVELPQGWKATLKNKEILLTDGLGIVQLVYEKPEFIETPKPHSHEHDHEHNNTAHDQLNKNRENRENEYVGYNLIGDYEINQNNNILNIKTKVPVSWLIDAERNFPLTIDPSTQFNVPNTAWWTGYISVFPNVTSTGASFVGSDDITLGRIYDYDFGGWDNYNGWIKFNINSLPAGATCVSAAQMTYVVYNSFSAQSDCGTSIRMNGLSSDPVPQASASQWSNLLTNIRNTTNNFGTREFGASNGVDGVKTTFLALDLINAPTYFSNNTWLGVGLEYFGNFGSGNHIDCFLNIRGRSQTNKPFLTITYDEGVGVETANYTQPSGCNVNGEIPLGGGAYKDIVVAQNTYYDFYEFNNNGVANGFCATPLNGNASAFSATNSCWFSGTTSSLRITARKAGIDWSNTSAVMRYRHTKPDAPTASGAGTYCFPPNLTATNVNCSQTIYWQTSASGEELTQGTGLTKNVTATGSWWARAYNNGCWSNASSQQTVTIASPGTAPSDANQWSVSAYWGSNFDYLSGFYTDTRTSFTTADRWSDQDVPTGTPSQANNAHGLVYSGCALPDNNHSYIYNRKGFDCKRYQINITGHDDHIRVKVDQNDDGAFEFNQLYNYSGSGQTNIWTGNLSASSRVIIEVQEFTGRSYAAVNFVDVSPAVTVNLPASNCINTSFNLSATGSFAFTSYSWSGNGVSNVNSSTTTATPAASGNQSYTVVAGIGNGCTVSDTKSLTVNNRPVPTFTAPTTTTPDPAAQVCRGQNVVYTTQTGGGISNYSWNIQGSSGSTYTIVGGSTSSNSVTLQWLTTGDKTVTVNYSDNNTCVGASPASNTQNVTFPVAPTLDTKSP